MNSKKIGNQKEQELCMLLSNNGYWVYLTPYNEAGQPCDVIALRKDKNILLDVKNCKTNSFTFNRLEPNQETCFEWAKKCGVRLVGLAIYFEKEGCFKWLGYLQLKLFIEGGMKQVKSSQLLPLEEVLKRYDYTSCE